MSSPLALAAVTAVLKDLLNEGLINHDLAAVGTVSVSALPPDRITTGDTEPNRLNLFLYRVSANPAWRNAGLPAWAADGTRLANPPLPLDLHYLLTAYGAEDFSAEILLGYAMELLHDRPLLTRADIRRSLAPDSPLKVSLIPKDTQGRAAVDLADQIETLKITPQYLGTEELSKLWTAMQARLRPTMAYEVSTVLIQGTRAVRSPLPVLARGDADRGPRVGASTTPAVPTLSGLALVLSDGAQRSAAELGDLLELSGAALDGDTVLAEFRHPLLAQPLNRPAEPGATASTVRVRLPQSHDAAQPGFDPAAAATWPAGSYSVALRIERAGARSPRYTDDWPLRLAPRLSGAPQVGGAPGARTLTVQFHPQARASQRVEVFVGGEGLPLEPLTADTGSLTLPLRGVAPSADPLPVRLRIDGVNNELVRDRRVRPPRFDAEQSVELPA